MRRTSSAIFSTEATVVLRHSRRFLIAAPSAGHQRQSGHAAHEAAVMLDDVFEVLARQPRVFAGDGFGPAALAQFDGVDDGAVLRLADEQRAAEGRDVRLLVEEGAGRGEGQLRDALDLAPDGVAAGKPGEAVVERGVELDIAV